MRFHHSNTDLLSPPEIQMSRGKFIVFEGLDRSGKTTTVNRLYEKLASVLPTKKIGFPSREGQLGRLIDGYLRRQMQFENETIHLIFSADRYEHRDMINKARRDSIVLCDRFSMSGIVYSAAKGLDLEWCIMSENLLPKPDLTVFIDTPMEELFRRKGFGDEVHDSNAFQEKVYDLYQKLLGDEEGVLVVNGSLPTDEIVEMVARKILE